MRRTTAVVAGMVLILGPAGCGQDSVEESSAELCDSIAELESGVVKFRSMLESGATRDELSIQLNSISAETKNVVLDAKDLAQSVQEELQATGETLKSDADELVDESLTDAQIKTGLESAVAEYEAGIASVKAQAGCSTQ
jgi:hypothetical protein